MGERRCGVEFLEERALLAAVAAGAEVALDDGGTGGYAPAVAMNSRGDFVAAWYEYGAAAGDADVYARRFDASGVAQGEAFRVNTSTAGIQGDPSVAIDDSGDFVISWTSGGPYAGTQGYDIYARRYDAAGNPQGDGFRVNTTTQGDQGSSGVAIDQDGDFVITWASSGSEGVNTLRGIIAQQYDSSGARRGGEIHIDEGQQWAGQAPSVASDPAGDWVVTWLTRVNNTYAIFARRFDGNGVSQGEPFLVNPDSGPASEPSVGLDRSGNFVIAWMAVAPGAQVTIYGRRFGADGSPASEAFLIGDAGEGGTPSVGMGGDGQFVVTWWRSDPSPQIYARQYDAAGAPAGEAFRVNDTTANGRWPAAAMNGDGDFVVVWMGTGLTPYGRLYRSAGPPAAQVVARQAFYNHSSFDGNEAAANAADDAAIATDKLALLPGQAASFANVTSFSHGLNGIMVDIANLPAGGLLGPDDFDIGGDGTRVVGVTVRRGAGVDGSDRVTLTWPDYDTPTDPPSIAVGNGWLRVTVKANANTGLAAPDVFSFGNLIGDTGDSDAAPFRVNALDLGRIKPHLNQASEITGRFDFNRDGRVNALDLGLGKANLNRALAAPAVPGAAPVAYPIPAAAPPTNLRRETPIVPRLWEDPGTALI